MTKIEFKENKNLANVIYLKYKYKTVFVCHRLTE